MIKIHYGVISRQNRLEKANEVRKKKLSFLFVPTESVIENFKKIQEIKKYHYGFFWSQNRVEKVEEERK